MALGDLMVSRFSQLTVSNNLDSGIRSRPCDKDAEVLLRGSGATSTGYSDVSDDGNTNDGGGLSGNISIHVIRCGGVPTAGNTTTTATSMVYLPTNVVLCGLRHDSFEASVPCGPSDSGSVSKWRPKDRAYYKEKLDPTVEEVKKLCITCRRSAKSERVLFIYNGHGVPKPTANGEIWVFNKSYTQYSPLPIPDLDSWPKTPSIYVFEFSAAGWVVNAFVELNNEWNAACSNGQPRDCILLAGCEAHETLPQSSEFPADVFTSCLTTPIKMALRWLISSMRLHTKKVERVVGIGVHPGLDVAKILSASQAGKIQFLDIRYPGSTYLAINAHRGSLTALAVHRHAPIIASGSADHRIKVFSLDGHPLGTIRYYPTFMAQKIGLVSCLAFHPYQVLLAAGAADACVSIYADENSQGR